MGTPTTIATTTEAFVASTTGGRATGEEPAVRPPRRRSVYAFVGVGPFGGAPRRRAAAVGVTRSSLS